MGKTIKGKKAASTTVSEIKTPEKKRNKKKLGKEKSAPSTLDSQQKNVRFDCNSAEKDHIKYITTPFLSSLKKDKAQINKSKEKIKKNKKLSFDEENTSASVKKRLSKKRKLDSDEKRTSDNNSVVKESQDAVTKEKKSKTEASKSGETVQDLVTAPVVSPSAYVNENERTIFVGNLPLTYDHKKIVKIFNKFGPIENARIRCVPVASVNVPKKTTAITKKFNPKRSSANAYVVFKSKESVKKAVDENGMVVDGHHLRIDYVVAKKKDIKKSVFVGGLPFDVEDDDLWNAFKDCGEIEGVRIVRDNVIGMGKGFGYVNFKSIASVELALKLNGTEIKDRKINVDRCRNMKKKKKSNENFASFKTKKKNNKTKIANSKSSLKVGKELSVGDFQGRTAEQKKKKKKSKNTPDALRRNKIKKVLNSSPKKLKKSRSKEEKPN